MNIGAQVAIQAATQAAINASTSLSRVFTALRDAGAVSPETAVRISIESSEDESTLASLLKGDMVRETSAGHYYINYLPTSVVRRRRLLALVCALALVVLAVLALLVVLRSGGGAGAR
jgi:hypothetical protein